VIYLDGSVHVGRPLHKSGAHCKGYNAHSVGICYIGGLASDGKTPKDTRTDTQKASLVKLITELRQQFPNASVHGHREFANKACPCFDAHKEYNDL
jgi:N-acetylmuramoyl-L-alanine amidase